MTNNFLKLDYHKGQEPNTLRILSEAIKRTSDFFVFSFKKNSAFRLPDNCSSSIIKET